MSRNSKALGVCFFAGVALLLQVPSAHAGATPAESFVQQSVNKGFAILKDASLTKQERDTQFRALLRSIIDFKRIAIFALGPYAQHASDRDLDGFVNAFSDYLLNMFHLDPQNAGAPTISVTGSKARAADDVIVTANIAGADTGAQAGMPLGLAFRVRKNAAGNDTIVDILVGGVSVAVTQRDEFAAWLQQHGGNVAQLSAELEMRVAAN
jgi:phospholipid transport system substrate-binding protein